MVRYPISSFNDCWCVSVHIIDVPDGSWPFFLSGDLLVAFLGVTPCERFVQQFIQHLIRPGEIWDITMIITQKSNRLISPTADGFFFCKQDASESKLLFGTVYICSLRNSLHLRFALSPSLTPEFKSSAIWDSDSLLSAVEANLTSIGVTDLKNCNLPSKVRRGRVISWSLV